MGALLLTAGTKGKRFALPNSRIMLHQPAGGIGGTAEEIRILADEMLVLKDICARIIAECTGQPLAKVLEDSERDFYMNPEDALKYGLIDKVVQPSSKPASPSK